MQLIAIDLDGTLLSESGRISAENRDMIRHMQKQGKTVTICSGRAIQDITGILEEAELQCPIIAANGAIIYDGRETIAEFDLGAKTFAEITADLIENDYYFEVYTNKGIQIFTSARDILEKERVAGNFSEEWAREQIDIQLAQKGLLHRPSYEEMLMGLSVYKIFVLSFDKEKLGLLRKELTATNRVSLTTSGWTKLEIAHREVSKGNGLRLLAGHFGIPMEKTVAIGDNQNDLPMFEVAGTSIAMGNADDSIKSRCTFTTKSFDENGVAYALKNFVC